MSIPPALLSALAAHASPEPSVGQLWRLRCEGGACLVWIRRVYEFQCAVLPVVLDIEYADEHCLLIDAQVSPVDVELMVITNADASVSSDRLLDCLGALPVVEQVRALRLQSSDGTPAGLPTGSAVADLSDPRIDFIQNAYLLVVSGERYED